MTVGRWNDDTPGANAPMAPFHVERPVDDDLYVGVFLGESGGFIEAAAMRNVEPWENRGRHQTGASEWQERFSFAQLLRTTAKGLDQLADEMEVKWAYRMTENSRTEPYGRQEF